MPKPPKHPITLMLLVLGLAGLFLGLYLVAITHSNNFHEVIPGELYRTAQLDPAQMDAVLRTHGIQTVVNLRGVGVGQQWFLDEEAVVQSAGAQLFSVNMRASRFFSPEEAHDLISVFQTAPKPILIHCKSGADRTGLAAALYLRTVGQTPLAEAKKQLSIKYGHFSLPFLDEFHMDRSLMAFDHHLRHKGL